MTASPKPTESLEASIGYAFRDSGLLRTALTPPSAGLSPHNQRLEFLGDAILQCCVSDLIYQEHPNWDEGSLSKLRGLLVCTDSLRDCALQLGVQLATGPRTSRRPDPHATRKPLADAFEALIAAIYLDARQAGQNPMEAIRPLVEGQFLVKIRKAYLGIWEEKDSKTTLQEKAASLGLPAPVYELVERQGPDHAPSFRVRVQIGECSAAGTGTTLKLAQADAARHLLHSFAKDRMS